MHSIAAALLTEIETRLTSTVAELVSSQQAQLTAAAERVLLEEQATDPAVEELEMSEREIVPLVDADLQAVLAMWVRAIVQGAELAAVRVQEEQRIVPAAAQARALDPVLV